LQLQQVALSKPYPFPRVSVDVFAFRSHHTNGVVGDSTIAEERMEAARVPVDVLHWVLAALPIVALLVFLVPLRWRAPEAGPMAMFVAAIVAVLAFRTPWDTLAVASAKGVWDAVFICM
jgi:hypothetical protein